MLETIKPFLKAKLNLERDERGYVIPRKTGVSIITKGVAFRDADVREADEDGIEICVLGGFAKRIAWSEIEKVIVEDVDV